MNQQGYQRSPFLSQRIEKFAVYHRDRRFLGMNIQSWADLMLMLSLWGAFHFALCTSIPNGNFILFRLPFS